MSKTTHIYERPLLSRDPDERPSARAYCGFIEDELSWNPARRTESGWWASASEATCKGCQAAYAEERARPEWDI